MTADDLPEFAPDGPLAALEDALALDALEANDAAARLAGEIAESPRGGKFLTDEDCEILNRAAAFRRFLG